MVKNFKWTTTKVFITILLIISLVFLLYNIGVKSLGEKEVCCKITMVLGPEYQPVTPSYKWTTESYCSNMKNGSRLMGASRVIVSDSFCGELKGNNLLSVSTDSSSQRLGGVDGSGVGG